MKIFAKSEYNLEIPASKLVNKIGKYMYKNIDSAYKIKISANNCDVFMTVYYQLPVKYDEDGNKIVSNVAEMNVDINITTYQNKIRVNLVEVSEREKTIGHNVFKPEDMYDVKQASEIILDKVKKNIIKEFKDFDFLF